MIKTELILNGAPDNPYELHSLIWKPDNGKIDTVIQIAHGMTEHIGRYENLAKVLTQHGVAVAGIDLRGHGKNVGDKKCASFGENGWISVIDDMHIYHNKLREMFPGTKHCLMGFSLGNFLTCDYINKYQDDSYDGVILIGMGYQCAGILSIMGSLIKREVKKAGWNSTTPLVEKLSFGIYNDRYKPNQTYVDWICSDGKETAAFVADELTRECISAGLFAELMSSFRRFVLKDAFSKWNKDIPILLISGKDDLYGNQGKAMEVIRKNMCRCGMKNVRTENIDNARHDVLHERESGAAEKTEMLIKDFLESCK